MTLNNVEREVKHKTIILISTSSSFAYVSWVYLEGDFLLKNIDCGYSLEPPRRCGSNKYPQSMF